MAAQSEVLQCSWFCSVQCSLEYPTCENLRVFSQDIRVHTLPFSYALFIFQENEHRENFSSHCCNVMEHHPVKSNALPPKINSWWKMQCCLAAGLSLLSSVSYGHKIKHQIYDTSINGRR
jgi:hypothetical protein